MAVNSAFEDAEEDAVPSTTANSDPLGLPWLTGALNANGLLNVSGGKTILTKKQPTLSWKYRESGRIACSVLPNSVLRFRRIQIRIERNRH